MVNDRHAFLIMAHNQEELLLRLLKALDDEKNDIYLHIDKKMKCVDKFQCEQVINKARIFYIKQMNVKWGDYSQINCEIQLLKEAIKTQHSYYHLISGVDIPLKRQDEIQQFFGEYKGLEFVDEDFEIITEKLLERIKYFYFWSNKTDKFSQFVKNGSLKIQKKLGINRINKYSDICFQKGRNWFSITHELAQEVVEREKWIRKVFKNSLCGDEMFLQTIARNSEFKKRICNNNTMPLVPDTRYIDWNRGTPYVFRNENYCELKNTDALFARKFDVNLDVNIIERLYKDLEPF